MSTARRTIYVHVGAPKTGTTYVQTRLAASVTELERNGLYFPSRPRPEPADHFQFRAAVDLLDQDWGGPAGHAKGAWDSLVRRVRRVNGNVLISHEILGAAPADSIARAMRDLSYDADVHIIYTVRDLARQIPAAWQESIKQGRKWRYRRFLKQFQSGKPWFARSLDMPTVLSNWGQHVPIENVHVVTVPPRSVAPANPDLLWERFCGVIGLDPEVAPDDSSFGNPSLGTVETEVVRRLNERLAPGDSRTAEQMRRLVGILAESQLVQRDSARVLLPPRHYSWAQEITDHWMEWLSLSGVDIVGDVNDLQMPAPPDRSEFVNPDRVPAKQLLDATLDAAAYMAGDAAKHRIKARDDMSWTKRVARVARSRSKRKS